MKNLRFLQQYLRIILNFKSLTACFAKINDWWYLEALNSGVDFVFFINKSPSNHALPEKCSLTNTVYLLWCTTPFSIHFLYALGNHSGLCISTRCHQPFLCYTHSCTCWLSKHWILQNFHFFQNLPNLQYLCIPSFLTIIYSSPPFVLCSVHTNIDDHFSISLLDLLPLSLPSFPLFPSECGTSGYCLK